MNGTRLGGRGGGRVVDAQIHVWRRVAVPGLEHRPEPLGYEQLLPLMDASGVERAILIPPGFAGDGNAEALRAATEVPSRFGVMGRLPLDVDKAPGMLAGWLRVRGMLGVRISFHADPNRTLLHEGRLGWFWEALQEQDIPFMTFPPHLLGEIRRVAERFPGIRVIIDHLGAASERTLSAYEAAIEELIKLAPLPNVAVKASTLPYYSQKEYPYEDLHAGFCRVLTAFGPTRVFWGSDLTRLRCSYEEAVGMMYELACMGALEREYVMGRALCEWLRWE